jgi:hypothetical protein
MARMIPKGALLGYSARSHGVRDRTLRGHDMKRSSIVLYAVLVASGCASYDAVIRNPLVVNGAVDPNQIERRHGYAESSRGLPAGSMSDLATLTRLGKDICFEAVLHELDPIDMRSVRAKLEVPGKSPLDQAELWPTPPVTHDLPGLVPNRIITGEESFCAARDYVGNCIAWSQRPIYATIMQPGTVQIFETHARMCFANNGYVTATTPGLKLVLTVPRPAKSFEASYVGIGWVWGAGDKRTAFRWGLAGAAQR